MALIIVSAIQAEFARVEAASSRFFSAIPTYGRNDDQD